MWLIALVILPNAPYEYLVPTGGFQGLFIAYEVFLLYWFTVLLSIIFAILPFGKRYAILAFLLWALSHYFVSIATPELVNYSNFVTDIVWLLVAFLISRKAKNNLSV